MDSGRRWGGADCICISTDAWRDDPALRACNSKLEVGGANRKKYRSGYTDVGLFSSAEFLIVWVWFGWGVVSEGSVWFSVNHRGPSVSLALLLLSCFGLCDRPLPVPPVAHGSLMTRLYKYNSNDNYKWVHGNKENTMMAASYQAAATH